MSHVIPAGTRLRFVRLPSCFEGAHEARIRAHLIGLTGTALYTSEHGTILVQWDDGRTGIWPRNCFEVIAP